MTGTDLPPEILQRLRCHQCGAELGIDGDEIRCRSGHQLPCRDGYVDARPMATDDTTERTLESFGYEWTTFADVDPEDEAFWAEYVRDVPLHELEGGIGLDAGCGKGRFTRCTARHLRAMVALDGSRAVEAAVRNLSDLPNVVVVRGDLRAPPLAPESFDFVSCLGVLHHLADPEAGFRALTRLVAPGGLLLLYLYSRADRMGLRSMALAATSGMRRVTVRMPRPLLRAISAPIALGLYAGVVLPGALGARLGRRRLAALPLGHYRRRPVRFLWLDTFDRLSAPVERRYVWSELEPWFEAAGMRVEAVREDAGFFIVARKPT